MRYYRIPFGEWRKCVHQAAAFESPGEYAAAKLLDAYRGIRWWLRNDPVQLRLPTPVDYFEPDFVYVVRRGNQDAYGILEIKGSTFWDGEGSRERLKADAACEWVRVVNEAGPPILWEFAVVLDQDAIEADTFEQMLTNAVRSFPQRNHPSTV